MNYDDRMGVEVMKKKKKNIKIKGLIYNNIL